MSDKFEGRTPGRAELFAEIWRLRNRVASLEQLATDDAADTLHFVES